jgi:PAS domain S-box-containing protein
VYSLLRSQISSALQGALLVERIQERTAEIARQKYVLDTFLANVPDSIYFKDRDSRFTQINQALAHLLGLAQPDEAIGKSDFDFFSEEQAQPKYDQEQTIMRTGEPILALEEPDAGGRWALTTKMPLRDEHGGITGTFGISRDITALKRAQEELQKHAHELAAAYEEIHILNTQLQEENLRMGAELDVSRRIQQMMLPAPQELKQIPGLDIVGYMQPADEVGGDYYDVLSHNGTLHIGIGDVTGHGLESGLVMLMTQTAIRTLLEHGETNPVAFVNTLNRTIYQNVHRMGVDKTLTFALLHYQEGHLKVVGQHEEILVVRAGGRVERLDTVHLGFPVGLEEDIHQWVHDASIHLAPGDGVVLYTDGITEAANLANDLYGLERLCEVVGQHWAAAAETIKQAVIDDVTRHIGDQKVYDDLTLVVLKHM